MTEKLQPLNENILVKRDPVPTMSKGGIIALPQNLTEEHRPHTGEVIAVGDKSKLGLVPGDRIKVSEWGWGSFIVDGEELAIVQPKDIQAKFTD